MASLLFVIVWVGVVLTIESHLQQRARRRVRHGKNIPR